MKCNEVELRYGLIGLRWGEFNKMYELVKYHTGGGCHVLAFFERTSDSYNMRTVGNRFFEEGERALFVAELGMRLLETVALRDEESQDE